MSIGRRIFYNTLAQSLGKIFAVIIGLVTLGLLSRHLRESGFGEYSTVIAYLGFLAALADFGLYLYVVREISLPMGDLSKGDKPSRNYKIISNALGLRLTMAGAIMLVGCLMAFTLPYEPIVKKAMFVGIAAFLFVSLNQVLVGIFQKHLVQHLVVLSETIGRAVNLGLVYFFVRQTLNVPYFILALAAANATIFWLTLSFAKRYETFGIEFDFSFWKKILKVSWPLVFAVILNLVYFKTDTIILSVFHTPKAVGIYSLPYKLLEGLLAFPAMFVGLIMPLLSASAFTDWKKFREILQNAFDAILLITVPMIIAVLFFAEPIVNLIRGQEPYLDSPRVLQILIFAAAIIFVGTLFGYSVVAVNQQKTMIKGYLWGAIIGLLMYLLLIPSLSYWGAAVGTVTTELVVAVYAYSLVKRTSGQKISWNILWPVLPGALALILFYALFRLLWIVEALLGAAIYMTVLIFTKAVPLDFVKEIFFPKPHVSIQPPSHES